MSKHEIHVYAPETPAVPVMSGDELILEINIIHSSLMSTRGLLTIRRHVEIPKNIEAVVIGGFEGSLQIRMEEQP
jgi:hypothetical protein